MSASAKLDMTDRKILDILQRHAKITNAQLSKDIELSPAPTLERVKKLENAGIIQSYHAKLNTKALGLGVTTFVNVKLAKYNKENTEEFLRKANEIPEVIECHQVTGNSHYLLKIITSDIETYQKVLLDKISAIEEIDDVQSMVVLSTPKDSNTIPIP
ncbi:Lrp/AsnC family transcriptional regulator [Sediminitomix flava]|uniref:AsnC family transcriptional regulator n=1 Tax=Sediminitomix flava TaxID=379075 RepID=A0A315ZJP3_SEDFL|nr:Lrp/AsnC family transcriptional regulator [Sediminitomix flava]PWJ34121.1 AsnC family transcriptional regulator [Sediminitomix flava]